MNLKNTKWIDTLNDIKYRQKTADTMDAFAPIAERAYKQHLVFMKIFKALTELLKFPLKGFRELDQKIVRKTLYKLKIEDTNAYLRVYANCFNFITIIPESTPKGIMYTSPFAVPCEESYMKCEVHGALSHLADRVKTRLVPKVPDLKDRNWKRDALLVSFFLSLRKPTRNIHINTATGEFICFTPFYDISVASLGHVECLRNPNDPESKWVVMFVHNTIITEDMYSDEQKSLFKKSPVKDWEPYTVNIDPRFPIYDSSVRIFEDLYPFLKRKFGGTIVDMTLKSEFPEYKSK
jgi:hypothetical protein